MELICKSYFCIQEQRMSIKCGWHLLVNTGMMAGKPVTYYIRARIWNEKQEQIGRRQETVTPRGDNPRPGILPKHFLVCSFCLTSTPRQFSFFFPSSMFQTEIRSNEQTEENHIDSFKRNVSSSFRSFRGESKVSPRPLGLSLAQVSVFSLSLAATG